jgi:hypothetical protein
LRNPRDGRFGLTPTIGPVPVATVSEFLGERVGVESSRETWTAEREHDAAEAVTEREHPRWQDLLRQRIEPDRLSEPSLRNPIFAAGIAALLIVALSLIGRITVRGEVLPGIHAGEVQLGGLSEAEATTQLSAGAEKLLSSRATLTYQGTTWTPTLAELGVSVDIDGSVDNAMDYGRSHHLFDGFLRPLHLSPGSGAVSYRTNIDLDHLDSVLRGYASEMGIAAVDPGVSYADGTATLIPGKDGQRFDTVAVAKALGKDLDSPAVVLSAVTMDIDISEGELAGLQPKLDASFAKSTVFTDGERTWSLNPADLAPLVHVVRENGIPALALDQRSVEALAAKLASQVNRAPVEPAMVDAGGGLNRLV